MIKLKRVYDPPGREDGFRVLVDRLWPRGVSKDRAKIDHWLRDAAPSAPVRRRFGHDPENWSRFRKEYARELTDRREILDELLRLEREHGTVTLLFGARDVAHNNAVVLKEVLESCPR